MITTAQPNAFQNLFISFVSRIFQAEANIANAQIPSLNGIKGNYTAEDKGYKCIHLTLSHFIHYFNQLISTEKLFAREVLAGREYTSLKFLDVGCGVGEKVFTADKVFGFDSYGLELREPLVNSARKLLDGHLFNVDKRIIQGNAITFNYKNFDVIYFYCPIADAQLEIELEKQIAKTAKVGAIVAGFMPYFFCGWNMDALEKLGWVLCNTEKAEGSYISHNYFKRISKTKK